VFDPILCNVCVEQVVEEKEKRQPHLHL
jgi:hypothetical protein